MITQQEFQNPISLIIGQTNIKKFSKKSHWPEDHPPSLEIGPACMHMVWTTPDFSWSVQGP